MLCPCQRLVFCLLRYDCTSNTWACEVRIIRISLRWDVEANVNSRTTRTWIYGKKVLTFASLVLILFANVAPVWTYEMSYSYGKLILRAWDIVIHDMQKKCWESSVFAVFHQRWLAEKPANESPWFGQIALLGFELLRTTTHKVCLPELPAGFALILSDKLCRRARRAKVDLLLSWLPD